MANDKIYKRFKEKLKEKFPNISELIVTDRQFTVDGNLSPEEIIDIFNKFNKLQEIYPEQNLFNVKPFNFKIKTEELLCKLGRSEFIKFEKLLHDRYDSIIENNKKLKEDNTILEQKNQELKDQFNGATHVAAIEGHRYGDDIESNKLEVWEDDAKNHLAEFGLNNTQIFTRRDDIEKMIKSIGEDYVYEYDLTNKRYHKILEPTSGDGAFTTYILEQRLSRIKTSDLKEFLLKSLCAIGTIYSIEYEAATTYTQRRNLYTILINAYHQFNINNNLEDRIDSKWDECIREIISENIIWGAFAATNDKNYNKYNNKKNSEENGLLGYYNTSKLQLDKNGKTIESCYPSNRRISIIEWEPSVKIDKKGKIIINI